jgi:hypothetical protein
MGAVAGQRGGAADGKPIRDTGFNDLLLFSELVILEARGQPAPTLKRRAIMEATKKFQIGQEISARSACDYDCVFRFTVVKRTAKTVTVKYHNELKTIKVRVWSDGGEYCYPLGTYSMAPSVFA